MSVERNNIRKKATPTTTTINTTSTSASALASTTSPQLNDSRHLSMPVSSTLVSSSSNYPLGISFSSNVAQMNESDDIAYIEKRTAHNALERQRREGLNTKFQELAHVLPALQQIRRPSKSMIVAKSLEFVSSASERENDFQGQIHALRKENEQLMRQASLSKRRIKTRLDKESISGSSEVNNKKSSSVMIKLSSKKRPSKLKPQSRQTVISIEQPSNVQSKKRGRLEDVDQPESSTASNKVKSPSPPCSSSSAVTTEVSKQPPSPPKISTNKRRKRNATVETYQHKHQQAVSTAVTTAGPHYNNYQHQTIDQSLIASVDLPSYQQPQHRILSSQRPRYNSYQPASANMLHQQQQQQQQRISPVVSRHNSLTLADHTSTAPFDFSANVTATPSQFSIIHSPFGNEHIFFNTFDNFDNIVSTIPALTTPSIGNTNNMHLHTPTSTSSTSSATSTNYDNSLDLIHSIMQSQDPSTDSMYISLFDPELLT
ncbi:hypothetical protein MAM1_0109c05517 [Mucor ambiguus]|uniref:BHLH domain-containing protein n=1 Tax=Mucor ambiguus TaxID=91626 RepID=A0A0C9LV26_9FUNG|nr:hypothetical protein MAM1_0109c05517 [Mucor ambiguus]